MDAERGNEGYEELRGATAGGSGLFFGRSLFSFGCGLRFSRLQLRAAAEGGVALEAEELVLWDCRGRTFHGGGEFCRGSFCRWAFCRVCDFWRHNLLGRRATGLPSG